MTTYINNLKWIIPSLYEPIKNSEENFTIEQKESNSDKFNLDKSNLDKLNQINIQTDNFDESHSSNGSESGSDYDYDKIISTDLCFSQELKNNQTLKNNHTLKSIQEDYNKIHIELVKKEQLVRNRVNSDTVEKIKENYTEFINDDVQIIREFATVMETFEHIKEKLKDFETEIKEFEEDIKKNNMNQDENKLELDNKINKIDLRLENTVQLMNQIKSNGDEFIKKIIHLENLIQSHDEHRKEILLKLEKFDKEHNEMKKTNLQMLNIFKDSKQYFTLTNSNYGYIKYIGICLGISSCVILTYNVLKKN
jgi:Rad3-related DNA helicase